MYVDETRLAEDDYNNVGPSELFRVVVIDGWVGDRNTANGEVKVLRPCGFGMNQVAKIMMPPGSPLHTVIGSGNSFAASLEAPASGLYEAYADRFTRPLDFTVSQDRTFAYATIPEIESDEPVTDDALSLAEALAPPVLE